MNPSQFLAEFGTIAAAPNGVQRLREMILQLAVMGKLVPQDPADEPASVLLQRIAAEKDRLIREGKIKRPKPLPAIRDDEKPFELPQDWEWVRLGELSSKIGAGSTPLGGQKAYAVSGIKFLRSQNIWNDGLHLDDVALITDKTHEKMSGTHVSAGDLLFNITGASIGRCSLAPDDFDTANVSQHVCIIRPISRETRVYLHKLSTSNLIQQAVMDEQVGVSREGLSIAKLSLFLIPLPPLAEQKRIVAKVDSLMVLCDKLETLQQQRQQLDPMTQTAVLDALLPSPLAGEGLGMGVSLAWQRLNQHMTTLFHTPESVKALRETILQLAVMGKLVPQDASDEPASVLLQHIATEKDRLIQEGKIKRQKPLAAIRDDEKPFELPNGWEWVRLDALITLISGQHLNPGDYSEKEIENGIPYISGPADFGVKHPDPVRFTKERRSVANADDILLTVKGSGVGKLNIASQQKLAIGRQIMAIRPIKTSWHYVYLWMKNQEKAFQQSKTGIAIPGIGRDDVLGAIFCLPPLAEQRRIVAKVDSLMALCDKLETRLQAAQETAELLAKETASTFLCPLPPI
ncbi:restriction endonuclease subunit S [Thiothrix lacustris]|uniref:restriction endonuclease subunit S n=1 Tax=Thiothrix lacustris TaxID=525917 RepID=UPI0027E50B65|nr:restriction endonuclease subunit S [Thiothrix lacustris]WMP19202.1 restriction endonuclease subunit S [Thiothrix lacustris]